MADDCSRPTAWTSRSQPGGVRVFECGGFEVHRTFLHGGGEPNAWYVEAFDRSGMTITDWVRKSPKSADALVARIQRTIGKTPPSQVPAKVRKI